MNHGSVKWGKFQHNSIFSEKIPQFSSILRTIDSPYSIILAACADSQLTGERPPLGTDGKIIYTEIILNLKIELNITRNLGPLRGPTYSPQSGLLTPPLMPPDGQTQKPHKLPCDEPPDRPPDRLLALPLGPALLRPSGAQAL